MSDHYNLLGVSPQASADEIRKAFRREAKHWHPDALASRPAAEREAARLRFIQLAQAYQVLGDPQRRRAYDRLSGAGAMPQGASKSAEEMARAGRHDSPRTAQRGPEAFRATQGNPIQDLRDVLEEAEQSLSRFGLDLRHPVEAVLEELLDWASALYRDLAGAVTGSSQGARPDAGAGEPRAGPGSLPRAEVHSGASARPGAGPSARQRARSGAAFRTRAEGEAARLNEGSVERELEQIRRSVRNGSARRAPTVDEELAELQRRHGKKP